MHDFIDPDLGKVASYRAYDLTTNTGWVNLSIDYYTFEFDVESIWRWCGRWENRCQSET